MSTTLAEDYLEIYGDPAEYRRELGAGLRIGQAFFNALHMNGRERLRGTIHDPFYRNDNLAVENAIEFLLYPYDPKDLRGDY